jgi:hypothetical protein
MLYLMTMQKMWWTNPSHFFIYLFLLIAYYSLEEKFFFKILNRKEDRQPSLSRIWSRITPSFTMPDLVRTLADALFLTSHVAWILCRLRTSNPYRISPLEASVA